MASRILAACLVAALVVAAAADEDDDGLNARDVCFERVGVKDVSELKEEEQIRDFLRCTCTELGVVSDGRVDAGRCRGAARAACAQGAGPGGECSDATRDAMQRCCAADYAASDDVAVELMACMFRGGAD